MQTPRAALFDLDDTLAKSLETPSLQKIDLLKTLLARMPVAIVTGRSFDWIAPDFLPPLTTSPHIDRFYLFPEAGAEAMQWAGGAWQTLYSHSMTREDFDHIRSVVESCLTKTGAYDGLPLFGERYLEKNSMFTIMALGLNVPPDLKYTWDPDNVRRKMLFAELRKALPEYEAAIGGATAIDIVRPGIDKALAVRWLSEHLGIPPSEMLFIGDALYEGGNDAAVIPTGIQTIQTSGPDETTTIIANILESVDHAA